ncbi:hypothetical protein BC832DRAFT_379888 [Gaertneriomyces semiglobifer]|nr:hypothetical protein BC832DRAFT_379888 [Gaertneriomyces semiglobifer]
MESTGEIERYEIRTFDGELGRAVVALTSFDIGEIVMRDYPILSAGAQLKKDSSKLLVDIAKALDQAASVFEGACIPVQLQANIIHEYMQLDEEKRRLIQTEFAVPSLFDGHDIVTVIECLAQTAHDEVSQLSERFTTEELRHLLLVMATNAHEFLMDQELLVGLYLKGSKLAHSCSPKTVYVSEGATLIHCALQPIQPGDLITTNYALSDNIRACWPTPLRREKLLTTKFFECKCERCVGPDDCRIMKCPGCKESAAVYHPTRDEPRWICTNCEGQFEDSTMPLRLESQLEQSVIDATAAFDDIQGVSSQSVQQTFVKLGIIYKTGTQVLGTEHWSMNWVKAFLCASRAKQDAEHAGIMALEFLQWSDRHIRGNLPHIHARYLASFGPYCVRAGLRSEFESLYAAATPWIQARIVGSLDTVHRLQALGDKPTASCSTVEQDASDWLPPVIKAPLASRARKNRRR